MPGPIHTILPHRGDARRIRVIRPTTWWPTLAMRQEEAFRRIWQALRQHDHVVSGAPDPANWRNRAARFAICVIPVTHNPGLIEVLEPLRASLTTFPFVRLFPDNQLFIPIQELGFIVNKPARGDETSLDRIAEFAQHATIPITDFPAFRVKLGGFNSFLDVPFLDVIDDGWCSRMHHRLRDFLPTQPDDSFAFLPHIVLGEYTRNVRVGSFPAQMAPWRDRTFGDFVADRMEIVGIPTGDPDAPPEVLHAFELGHERGPAQTIATPSQDFR